MGFKFWISVSLNLFLLFPLYFSRKWLCLGFHSWRAFPGLNCFHLFYFNITKPFPVIFGFAIHSSLCFTKTIKPTLSKNAVLSKMDSVLLGEQKRMEPVCVINISREIASFPELVLDKGCWPLVRFRFGLLTLDPTWTWLWMSWRHLPASHPCPFSSRLFSPSAPAGSAPAIIFLRTGAMKNQDFGFLNECFYCWMRWFPVTEAQPVGSDCSAVWIFVFRLWIKHPHSLQLQHLIFRAQRLQILWTVYFRQIITSLSFSNLRKTKWKVWVFCGIYFSCLPSYLIEDHDMELRWRTFSCRPVLLVGTWVLDDSRPNPTSPYEITGISNWPPCQWQLWSQSEAWERTSRESESCFFYTDCFTIVLGTLDPLLPHPDLRRERREGKKHIVGILLAVLVSWVGRTVHSLGNLGEFRSLLSCTTWLSLFLYKPAFCT